MIFPLDFDACYSSPCHVQATCQSTDGVYNCTCNAGYAGDGETNCTGIIAMSFETV